MAVFTEERIAWRPKQPASEIEGESFDLDPGGNLPEGWRAAQSHHQQGEIVFENIHTLERIAWRPKQPASSVPGESPDVNPNADLPDGWAAVESHYNDVAPDNRDWMLWHWGMFHMTFKGEGALYRLRVLRVDALLPLW